MDAADSAIDLAAALALDPGVPEGDTVEVAGFGAVDEQATTDGAADPDNQAANTMIATINRVVPPSARNMVASPLLVVTAAGRAIAASGASLSIPTAIGSVALGLLLPVGGRRNRWIPFAGSDS